MNKALWTIAFLGLLSTGAFACVNGAHNGSGSESCWPYFEDVNHEFVRVHFSETTLDNVFVGLGAAAKAVADQCENRMGSLTPQGPQGVAFRNLYCAVKEYGGVELRVPNVNIMMMDHDCSFYRIDNTDNDGAIGRLTDPKFLKSVNETCGHLKFSLSAQVFYPEQYRLISKLPPSAAADLLSLVASVIGDTTPADSHLAAYLAANVAAEMQAFQVSKTIGSIEDIQMYGVKEPIDFLGEIVGGAVFDSRENGVRLAFSRLEPGSLWMQAYPVGENIEKKAAMGELYVTAGINTSPLLHQFDSDYQKYIEAIWISRETEDDNINLYINRENEPATLLSASKVGEQSFFELITKYQSEIPGIVSVSIDWPPPSNDN